MCKRRTLLPCCGRSLARWFVLAMLPVTAWGHIGVRVRPRPCARLAAHRGDCRRGQFGQCFRTLIGKSGPCMVFRGRREHCSRRTASGRTFTQTTDLEIWTPTNVVPPVAQTGILALPVGSPSVPGTIRDLAASPVNPEEITVATDLGVFRSADSGKSWMSLNDGLPNLPVKRLLNLPEGGEAVRIELAGNLAAEWPPGEKSAWLAADNLDIVSERQLRGALSAIFGGRPGSRRLRYRATRCTRARRMANCARRAIVGKRGKCTRRARARWSGSGLIRRMRESRAVTGSVPAGCGIGDRTPRRTCFIQSTAAVFGTTLRRIYRTWA